VKVQSLFRSLSYSALMASAWFAPLNLHAQDNGEAVSPVTTASALNLPQTIVVMGKANPNIRTAVVTVNNEVITETDINRRMALVVLANGGKISQEQAVTLRLQILRNLIDESLEIEDAKQNKIEIKDDEVEESYSRVAFNQKKTPEQFSQYLISVGSSDASLKRQIKAEMAWRRVISRNVDVGVNVGDDEVQDIINNMLKSKGQKEYHVYELYMSATPETSGEVVDAETKILGQLKNGGSFPAYARQFSQASTASVGGDLGWVRPEVLPKALADMLPGMSKGQIAGPVAIPGGYDILYVADSHTILGADSGDTLLSLRQLALSFPKGTTQQEAKAKFDQFNAAAQNIRGCGSAKAVAAQFNAQLTDSDGVKASDIPAQLSDIVLKLPVGQATPAFGSLDEGVRFLILCGREDPKPVTAPNPSDIRESVHESRLNVRVQRYLRDLRRDAIIEYR
jgi:peptidyl-prolyl cis-trans isomerase SurA